MQKREKRKTMLSKQEEKKIQAFEKFKNIVKSDKHLDEWDAINCYNYDKGEFEWMK